MSYRDQPFRMAPDCAGFRQTVLGNGAIVRDSLDDMSPQEAVQIQLDGYFSQWGIDLLIKHLEDLKKGLKTNG